MSSWTDLDGLRLDDAMTLLRQSGHALPDRDAVPPAELLQKILDGLCELSSVDALTGLVNVRQFRAALDQELDRVSRSGAPMALLLIDADRFKSVNDTYGHQAGDRVLRAIAQGLREKKRTMDTLARFGGEEFAAILPNCLPAHASRVAERYRNHISQTAIELSPTQSLRVTVSIGVACVMPWQKTDRESLIAAADRQLYVAKNNGRNRVASDTAPETGVTGSERAALLSTDPTSADD